MNYEEIVQWLMQHAPPVVVLTLSGLGALVVLGTAYVALSPSKDDDAWMAKLYEKPIIGHVLKFLTAFSPVDKKKDGVVLSNKAEEKPEAPKV